MAVPDLTGHYIDKEEHTYEVEWDRMCQVWSIVIHELDNEYAFVLSPESMRSYMKQWKLKPL
jgi:hypothetical protein